MRRAGGGGRHSRRRRARADRLEELAESHRRIAAEPCDVTSGEDCARVVALAVALGGPHILVNAAGFGDPVPAFELSVDGFRRTSTWT